jgi:hypothetical protein
MPRFEGPLGESIAGEIAASLGLAGKRLQRALDALRAYDSGLSSRHADAFTRQRLLESAAEACWGYVIQREILGFGLEDAQQIRAQYAVPDEVWNMLGARSHDA